MSKNQKPKKENAQTADDILSSLMDDLKDVDKDISDGDLFSNTLGLDPALLKNIAADKNDDDNILQLEEGSISSFDSSDELNLEDESSLEGLSADIFEVPSNDPNISKNEPSLFDSFDSPVASALEEIQQAAPVASESGPSLFGQNDPQPEVVSVPDVAVFAAASDIDEKTAATEMQSDALVINDFGNHDSGDGEKTVAVAGFSQRAPEDYGDKVKVSVGQIRNNAFSSGYAAWGSSDSNLAHAENLRIAQEKILDLEKENEKLRSQNEELIAASEIVKERADLLTGQLHEFKADRDSLEQSFKNETGILKAQIMRKDAEIVKASMKIEELESRMKFDLKKIRVRERELENRLELIRAEKNALVKSKDDQILDVRRKLDQVQMEVESYRQKCVDLNKVLDTNQESFKRTTRALRLAMANLELQEENKPALKKVD